MTFPIDLDIKELLVLAGALEGLTAFGDEPYKKVLRGILTKLEYHRDNCPKELLKDKTTP